MTTVPLRTLADSVNPDAWQLSTAAGDLPLGSARGESPPASGGFFCNGSGILFASTERAFSQALGASFATSDEFLRFFSCAGCFLEDLSHSPVDRLPPREREQALEDCVEPFAARLRTLSPELIVVFLKKIAPFVGRAARLAGTPSESIHVLPFPGMGNQNRYVAELAPILRWGLKP